MAESQYPDDLHFAGLVQAATAAADEHDRHVAIQNKRKHSESFPEDDYDDHGLQIHSEINPGTNDGVLHNSASVLFREPSAKSKKYSRPPLGKVYASLELAPEHFLRLQAAAKDFMLDPQYPERKNVVGHRSSGGNADVAKLRLWNCVEDFLSSYGYGIQYFGRNAGEDVPGAPVRTFYWPDHDQKIIRLMMPLMRKMVTNERQRVYAAETRKVPVKDHDATIDDAKLAPVINMSLSPVSTSHADKQQEVSNHTNQTDMEVPDKTLNNHSASTQISHAKDTLTLHVNLLSRAADNTRRVIPKFRIDSDRVRSLASLRKITYQFYSSDTKTDGLDGMKLEEATVKVWLLDGLVPVNNDGEWMVALLDASRVEWMDREVTVLIEA